MILANYDLKNIKNEITEQNCQAEMEQWALLNPALLGGRVYSLLKALQNVDLLFDR